MDISGRYTKSERNPKILRKILQITRYLLFRCFALQGAVPVVLVMEALKPFSLGYHLIEALKVLGPEKRLVKDILKLLYDNVSLGLRYGDKYWLDAKVKA
jgi:hypothetical protein